MALAFTSTTFNLPRLQGFLRLMASDYTDKAAGRLSRNLLVPLIAMLVFLGLWSLGAKNVETSLGVLPGPGKVWEQLVGLYDEHRAERAKADAFYERMQKRIDKAIAAGKPQEKIHKMATRNPAVTVIRLVRI